MVSITYLIFVFSILECGILISRGSPLATENSPIPLSDLVEELRRESENVRLQHLSYMFLAESCGNRVYDVSKNPSAECSTIMRATTIMFEKLVFSEVVNTIVNDALQASVKYLEGTKTLEEHPLEPFCKRAAEKFSGNATLQVAFEKSKNEAAKSKVSHPFSQTLSKFNTMESVAHEMVDKFTVPEFARIFAVASFLVASLKKTPDSKGSLRLHFFAKSCQAVAAEENFADSIQSAFMKAMNDTIPDIAVENRHKLYDDGGGLATVSFWWTQKMMKTLYSYIATDATLKAELENKAASFSAEARQEDLDFSKL